MDQSELGKTEEGTNVSQSAELPENEQGTVRAEAGNGAKEDVATEIDAQQSDVQDSAEDAATEIVADDSSDEDAPDEDVEPGKAQATQQSDDEDDDDNSPAADDQTASNGLRRGDIVQGKVSSTTPMAVNIVLENGVEGRVPARELELMSRKQLESLQEGADVTVFVVNPLNHKGDTILSLNQAQEEIDWREAEEYLENKRVYDGRIGGYNKGGLIVRFGQLRGFVPQSQIGDTRMRLMSGETPEERYGSLINENISVKVMEVDRSRNRLILSERAAMREVRQRRKESLITELEVGEDREGVVVSLENFGAFVDIGGAEGLVHLTEISWEHLTHPRQALKVGQDVNVKVISVDADNNRIGLSIKSLLPDPWDEIAATYPAGTLVRGSITKLAKFGAFAKLLGSPSVEGLIHISEMADHRVEHPRDVVKRGDDLTLRVVKVDVKDRRLGLSIKRVNSEEYLDQDLERAYSDSDYQEAADQPIPAKAEAEKAEEEDEGIIEQAKDAVEGAVETVQETVEDAAEAVEDAVESVAERVEDAVENITGDDDDDDDDSDAGDDDSDAGDDDSDAGDDDSDAGDDEEDTD